MDGEAARAELLGGVLGIDPGLRATGWGVVRVDPGGAAHLAWGVVRTPPPSEAPLPERLRVLFERTREVIRRYQPAAMAVERPFLRRNVRSAMALGQAQGAALTAGAAAGLIAAEYPPREVREAVAGDGSADKRAVADALRRRLRLPELDASADASDALAVAYCHLLVIESRGRLAAAAR